MVAAQGFFQPDSMLFISSRTKESICASHCLSFTQVFDAFKERLQESNSKVNLYALEALQKIITLLKDNLAQVVYILVPAIVDNHLNSKNNSIYTAATGAIHALIDNLGGFLSLLAFRVYRNKEYKEYKHDRATCHSCVITYSRNNHL